MFKGGENKITCDHLRNGEQVIVVGVGNSMTPILKSREAVICNPITNDTELKKRDIVLCKVNGRYYLHLISAIRGNQYQISNNHGHVNGWITKDSIYGIVSHDF